MVRRYRQAKHTAHFQNITLKSALKDEENHENLKTQLNYPFWDYLKIRLQGVISQKTTVLIFTDVKNSNHIQHITNHPCKGDLLEEPNRVF
jgi:hypothetical protein